MDRLKPWVKQIVLHVPVQAEIRDQIAGLNPVRIATAIMEKWQLFITRNAHTAVRSIIKNISLYSNEYKVKNDGEV